LDGRFRPRAKQQRLIRTITIEREAGYNYNRARELLKVATIDYQYCSTALLIPNEIKGTEKEATYKNDAEEERSLLFNAPELQPHLKRVKP
jgi:hypothetical protein